MRADFGCGPGCLLADLEVERTQPPPVVVLHAEPGVSLRVSSGLGASAAGQPGCRTVVATDAKRCFKCTRCPQHEQLNCQHVKALAAWAKQQTDEDVGTVFEGFSLRSALKAEDASSCSSSSISQQPIDLDHCSAVMLARARCQGMGMPRHGVRCAPPCGLLGACWGMLM